MLTPVLLSGGVGSRLWPVSRETHPKQFLPLAGELSMLQETLQRSSGLEESAPLVVCNNDVLFHRPFCDRLAALDPARLYGFWTHTIFEQPYLSSWCLLISKTVLERVGMFDEAFAPMWFEDADYCIRAQAAGVPLVELDRTVWGIEHLAPDRKDERALFESAHGDAWKRNQAYLREKHGL